MTWEWDGPLSPREGRHRWFPNDDSWGHSLPQATRDPCWAARPRRQSSKGGCRPAAQLGCRMSLTGWVSGEQCPAPLGRQRRGPRPAGPQQGTWEDSPSPRALRHAELGTDSGGRHCSSGDKAYPSPSHPFRKTSTCQHPVLSGGRGTGLAATAGRGQGAQQPADAVTVGTLTMVRSIVCR